MPPSVVACSPALSDLNLILPKIKDPLLQARLAGLPGDDAQRTADSLSTLLHEDGGFSSEDKRHLLTLLQKLVKSTQVLPQIYKLQGIQCDFSRPRQGGAFADIFQGEYKGRNVCVKAVRIFQKDDNIRMLSAFAKEIVLWAHLSHENILPFYGIYQGVSERICIISPWVDPGDLSVYLQSFPYKPRLPLVLDITAGLRYLHQSNIVHGDLKAKNILVSDHGRALIADFGISCIVVSKELASTQLAIGTMRWMAPELLIYDGENFPSMTPQSDVWSLGCVYYEVFTRKVPFYRCVSDYHVSLARLDAKSTPSRPRMNGNFVDEISDDMWALMKKCWDHEPCSRPNCNEVHEFITDLVRVREQRHIDLWKAIEGGSGGITCERACCTSIASLESPASVTENESLFAVQSLCQYVETPTETNSLRSENVYDFPRPTSSPSSWARYPDPPATSLESLESRIYTTHVTSRKNGTSTATDSQRLGNQCDLQSLTEHSPRIIAVMGPSGVGKSTFIKAATGVDHVRVGHNRVGHKLLLFTENLRAVRCRHPSKDGDIVLVDTPGFDDTFKSDAQILEQIADWLKNTYQAGVKLSGILYLHRITDNRITNTIMRNLDMFQKLCGTDALSSIILVTTNWDLLDARNIHEGEANEKRLRDKYWKPLLSSGSMMLRFDNTYHSAWNIIDSLPETAISLEIQREMIEKGKSLRDTAAGRSLSSWLQKTGQAFHKIKRRLELRSRDHSRDVADSSDSNDAETKRYEEDLRQANRVLKVVNNQAKQLSGSRSIASSVVRKTQNQRKKKVPP